jgi:zinc protease
MRSNVANSRFALLTAALVFTTAAFSQTLPKGVQKVTAVEGITEYTLPNGLHVLLFPDASKPKVTVNVTYLVGSRHEGYGETGMAHLLEHMLFKQTKSGRDVKKELSGHGAQFNGSTDWDRTNYFETVNATDENLKWAILLEAERMTGMRIEKALLDTEMTVVRNEFELGESDPSRILMQRVMEAAYTFHAYGRSPIGSRSDIENVSIPHLDAFYQKHYQPDDAVLTVAGKFDESKALAWIAESFGAIPRPTRKLEPTYTVEPTQDGERSVTLRRVGENQVFDVLYHVPSGSHPDSAALEVLTSVLGDVPSGRLYKALVDNKKAVSASMFFAEQHDPGFLMGSIRLGAAQSMDEARQIALKTIEGLVAEPPSKEEVERSKTRLLKNLELTLTNSEEVGIFISEAAAAGDWRLIFLGRDDLKKVTEQDVLRVAKAYLKESNRTAGTFVPTKNPDRAEIPPPPDVTAMLKDYKGGASVSQGEVFDPTPANIEARVVRSKLANGTKVALLQKQTRGGTVIVQMTLRFADEKALFGKSSVAQMAGSLLMRGTRNKSRQQIQDEIDRLKAHISVSGSFNNANASIETTEANLPGALRLVAEILREPAFPENEFEQIRQQRIAAIENSRTDPQAVAFNEMNRHLASQYARGDWRYVSTPDEAIEDLKKVTLADVRSFYQQFYGISESELAISGQFDKAAVQKLVGELFGEWKSPVAYKRPLTPYAKLPALDRRLETPDKQNAFFIAALKTKLSDDDPDYPAMLLADYMLGGSTASRLFTRIREKEGLGYTVQSQLSVPTKDDGATFMGIAISAPQNGPKVEASFKDELAHIVKDGFKADEVASSKKAWLEEESVARSQDGALTRTLMFRDRFDRTLKWDEALEAKVAALTADQVTEAFRRHVDLAAISYVKAGDFKKAGVSQ